MNYQDILVARKDLSKYLETLDSDEGIRVENKGYFIYINKISKRFCTYLEKDNSGEFFYMYSVNEVLDFLSKHVNENSKIFFY